MTQRDESTSVYRLGEAPGDFVSVHVDRGELVVHDCNGARLLALVPPSASGVVVWQLDSYLGVARAPGFERGSR